MERLTKKTPGFPDDVPLYDWTPCEACRAENTEDDREAYGCPECDNIGDLQSRIGMLEDTLDRAGLSVDNLDEIEKRLVPVIVNGDTSDGYHTFNELYHHRAVLFAVIVRNYPDLCWKSKQHHDGSMYPGMFIVGIDTPDGQASYHYDVDPYWDMFNCKELVCAPVWDGHTPSEAIERIGKLGGRGE